MISRVSWAGNPAYYTTLEDEGLNQKLSAVAFRSSPERVGGTGVFDVWEN